MQGHGGTRGSMRVCKQRGVCVGVCKGMGEGRCVCKRVRAHVCSRVGMGVCASRREQQSVCARVSERTGVRVCVQTCGHGRVLVQAGGSMLDHACARVCEHVRVCVREGRVWAGVCTTVAVHTSGSTHMCADMRVSVHMSVPTCVRV